MLGGILSKKEASSPQSENSDFSHEYSKPTVPARGQHESRRKRKGVFIGIAIVLVLAIALGVGLGCGLKPGNGRSSSSHNSKGPNVLLVMTDDQDVLLNSMDVMPHVKSMIGEQGTTFDRHYCTVAWCCPSRVNFLTGKAAHNTNVTSTSPPYGGWQKFSEQGLNNNYLPVWLHDEGISTYYVGKLMNGYGKSNLASPAPPRGWTDSSFLLDPWTYNYYNSHWTTGDFKNIQGHKGEHTTDVTENKALDMIDAAADAGNQFFMMVAPVAPHAEIANGMHPPPVPAAFRGNFSNEHAPRTGNFNPDVPSGASWVKALPKMTDKEVETGDIAHRHRLGNIAAVDVMVKNLIDRLDDHGLLDNTYVVYTTDNGFHIGNHRMLPGKRCPYEEDINIPLLIRGPDVPKGQVSSITNSHTDMAPTILQMMNVNLRDDFDGAPIAYTKKTIDSSDKHEIVNVEFWSSAGQTPLGLSKDTYFDNTYKALRLMNKDYNLFYSTWCNGDKEFYDMKNDYIQMDNRLAKGVNRRDGAKYYGRSELQLIERLDALLMVTKSCKQDSCREPWKVLFPDGEVNDLEAAMDDQYDQFFANQPQVTFTKCAPGHIIAEEGPQTVLNLRNYRRTA